MTIYRLLARCSMLLFALSAALGQDTFRWSNLAGSVGGAGDLEGTGSAARLNSPTSTAVDAAGNVYVADEYNHIIRKITSAGVMTTLAGAAGIGGSADGTGTEARFFYPKGVAVDGSGNVYVADADNFTVRKITPAGVVTTLAGMANQQGSADGAGSAARFSDVSGVAVDGNGNVYVSDRSNYTVRKITSDGVVSTFAGSAGNPGSIDASTGSVARFKNPYAVAVDGSGNVYVTDTLSYSIRKITPGGAVSTLPVSRSFYGFYSGVFFGVAVDGSGNVYASLGNSIFEITAAGQEIDLAGEEDTSGWMDDFGFNARFNFPTGLSVDGSGNVFVADTGNHTIRKISGGGQVSTFAGLAGGFPGSTDDTGAAARFNRPSGVAVDSLGNAYVADTINYTIRKITAAGAVSTLAGSPLMPGLVDGVGTAARFYVPAGVAVDANGVVYVADTGNHVIRKITGDGTVSTLAGGGRDGTADGTGAAARFSGPGGISLDPSGLFLYVADTGNCTIRKVATDTGEATTLAGLPAGGGSADGTGTGARFFLPQGVYASGGGEVWVADTGNHLIRKVTAQGVVTTVAGKVQTAFGQNYGGYADGTGEAALFDRPTGITRGRSLFYVTDAGSQTIRALTQAGVVTTAAGVAYAGGNQGGTGSVARFNNPAGIAASSEGHLYVTSEWSSNIAFGRLQLLLSPVTITSSNANPAWAKAGDTITFHFVSNQPLQSRVVLVGPDKAAISGSGTDFTATMPTTAMSTQGPVSFQIEATDLAGNSTTVTATTDGSSVTIDNTPPSSVTPPASFTVEATSPGGAIVNYPPATGTDSRGPVTITYSQASGTLFPLGTTTVLVTATDAAGNSAQRTFRVTVQDRTPPVISGPFSPLILFVGDPMPNYVRRRTSPMSPLFPL